MRTQRWLLAIVLVTVTALGLGMVLRNGEPSHAPRLGDPSQATDVTLEEKACRRIVSMAPSITESLFALGLGERIVGVTDFCDHPSEALTKSKVGGYYNLNYEAVLALRPDLVVCLPEHHEHLESLDQLDLKHMTVDHRRVTTILESLIALGQACNASDQAQILVQEIRRRMAGVQNRVIDERRPRVLVCVGRNMGSATIDEVYVAGRGGFYDEMITLAGGTNAYQDNLAFPLITGEGLLRLEPEIIIDMVADLPEKGLSEAAVLKQWDSLGDLQAVRDKRVFLFTEDFVVIPGPRFIQILEKMAAVIHPEGTQQ